MKSGMRYASNYARYLRKLHEAVSVVLGIGALVGVSATILFVAEGTGWVRPLCSTAVVCVCAFVAWIQDREDSILREMEEELGGESYDA